MEGQELVEKYNYTVFKHENFSPWMKFEQSPRLGVKAPDFPLWDLDGGKTRLSEIWSANKFTVIEFGSFT